MKPRLSWLLAGFASGAVLAQTSGGPYAIPEHTIDTGGGRASGGDFVFEGTLGQPDAGPAPGGAATGGDYRIEGGFWPGAAFAATDDLFRDGFE